MLKNVEELYPEKGSERALQGLYLQQELRAEISASAESFVYANFISSLDGRIAVPHADGNLTVPASISNRRDWRLFQELAVQADIVLSSGRYLREYAQDRAQEILRIYDDPSLSDLADWRLSHGLDRYPPIAVISASLNFPLPEALIADGRKVVIITTEDASDSRIREFSDRGLTVIRGGKTQVTGDAAIKGLRELGYQLIYSAAGPRVLHLLLEGKVLDRLYLTFAARILGGHPFSTILAGPLLAQPAELSLRHLYLDRSAPGEGGQLFAAYDLMS